MSNTKEVKITPLLSDLELFSWTEHDYMQPRPEGQWVHASDAKKLLEANRELLEGLENLTKRAKDELADPIDVGEINNAEALIRKYRKEPTT